ncbi:MAG: L,D-transpeptidase family protein [Methylococcales bacterium]
MLIDELKSLNTRENGQAASRLRRRSILLLFLLNLLSACQSFFPSGWDDRRVEPEEPEPTANWVERHRFSIDSDIQMVGHPIVLYSRPGDTLPDIARHFGLGYSDITQANPEIEPWAPSPGSRITIPLRFILPDSPRKGLVVNLPDMRLFYFLQSGKKQASEVITYPIGIGREGWSTPTGKTQITAKQANPTWTVPDSIRREHEANGDPLPRVVKAGPDNPLGLYALRLSIPSYLIHGTNKPYGVGMRISHGCMRLYPENIEPLFKDVSVGTPVRIVKQPYLIAWHRNMLYLEAHSPLENDTNTLGGLKKNLLKKISAEARKTTTPVDFDRVERVLEQANGIPTPILKHSQSLEQILASADVIRHPSRFYGTPEVAPIRAGDWTATAGTFQVRSDAETLARILLHQGPPIPARVQESASGYEVILGPFDDREEAGLAKKRIFREFEIDITLIEPTI